MSWDKEMHETRRIKMCLNFFSLSVSFIIVFWLRKNTNKKTNDMSFFACLLLNEIQQQIIKHGPSMFDG